MLHDNWGAMRGRVEQTVKPAHIGRADAGIHGPANVGAGALPFTGEWVTWSGSTMTSHMAFLFGIPSHGFGDGELASPAPLLFLFGVAGHGLSVGELI